MHTNRLHISRRLISVLCAAVMLLAMFAPGIAQDGGLVTLSFDTNGGNAISSVSGPSGMTVDLDALSPARQGYDFVAWHDEAGSAVSGVITVLADRTLTARWTPAETAYTVVYYRQVYENGGLTYAYAESVSKSALTGEALSVTGELAPVGRYAWYQPDAEKNAAYSGTVLPDGSAVVPVYYRLQEVSLSFDAGSGSFADGSSRTVSVRLGQSLAGIWPTASDVTLEGSYFAGWRGASTTYVTYQPTATATLLGEGRFTAVWSASGETTQVQYYLQDADGSYSLSDELSQTIPYTETLKPKAIAGYVCDESRTVHEDNVYRFYYDRASYRFEYYNGGTLLSTSEPVLFGADTSAYGALVPTDEAGRLFAGWYVDSTLTTRYTFETMPAHNVALYAAFRDPSVTFADGDTQYSVTVPVGQAVARPATPAKEGYTFLGWLTADGTAYDFTAPVYGSFTLTASYSHNALTGEILCLDMDGQPIGVPAKTVTLYSGETYDVTASDVDGFTFDHRDGPEIFALPSDGGSGEATALLYYRKDLTVGVRDLEKVYDGTALSPSADDVWTEGLAEGHSLAGASLTGSQTEPGESAAAVSSVAIDGPASGNSYYAITFSEGTLRVLPAPTAEPTAEPTPEPTAEATAAPTAGPTAEPTAEPTLAPEETAAPTAAPVMALSTRKMLQSSALARQAAAAILAAKAASNGALGDSGLSVTLEEGQTVETVEGVVRVLAGDGTLLAELADGRLTIHAGPVTLSGETTVNVVVDGDAAVTLAGVEIKPKTGAAVQIVAGAACTLTLQEGTENTLQGADNAAGLEVGWASHDSMADLVIEGEGTLYSYGGLNSAGIGGSSKSDNSSGVYGNITINSGTIVAAGYPSWNGGAGIGSSANPAGGTSSGSYKFVEDQWGVITINGGDVTATAGGASAGIGGGNHSDSGKIIINDGTVTATGHTGIGSGYGSSKPDSAGAKGPGYYYADIEIHGGTVTATALQGGTTNDSGAGIGGGEYSDARILITGGTIVATGADAGGSYHHGGAGIGGGYMGHAEVIITGGDITAQGGGAAAGIGSGSSPNNNSARGSSRRSGETTCDGTSVVITGGMVSATGGNRGGAGIGGGVGADEVSIDISGGTIVAVGSASDSGKMNGGAGIGGATDGGVTTDNKKYFSPSNVTISITDGDVTAIGGWGASAIGSGAEKAGSAEYTERTSIEIAEGVAVQAYADGTKFAIDTRLLNADGTTSSVTEGRTISELLLQGTFVHSYDIDVDGTIYTQDPEGLSSITVYDADTGLPEVTLLLMPEAYRSFATTVSHAGEYLVFTDAETIGIEEVKGRYFGRTASDIYDEDEILGDDIRYTVTSGSLSDNYYLFPVKTIRVQKAVQMAEGYEDMLDSISFTAYFALFPYHGSEMLAGTGVQSIPVVNGVPQTTAMFVNVPEGQYDIWETDETGARLSLNTTYDTVVLTAISTADSSGSSSNNGEISSERWSDSIVVTNVFEPITTEAQVLKIWDDEDDAQGLRPDSLTVSLSNGSETVATVTLNEENEWTAAVTGLPVYIDGEEAVYAWTEDELPEGYSLSDTTVEDTLTTLTNTLVLPDPTPTPAPTAEPTPEPTAEPTHAPEPVTTEATIVKVWDDDDDRDGLRPASLLVTLSDGAQVVLTEDNGWTATVDGLPVTEDGEEIAYTWTEETPEGYTLAETTVEGTVTTLRNLHEPETVLIAGAKTWDDADDADGLRPESITVSLLADGETVGSVTVTAADGWAYSFGELPRYDAGQEIAYTITEDAVPGYETTVTGYDLTNTHAPAVPEAPVRYTLTVRYWVNGETAFPTFTATYNAGDPYYVVSPNMAGYDVDIPVVSGTIVADTEADVYYTPRPVRLTVLYQFLDGTTAAATYTETMYPADGYDVSSPAIDGYRASRARVTGTMPGHDVEVVVLYVPQTDTTIVIVDYDTPLGIGSLSLNTGECFE